MDTISIDAIFLKHFVIAHGNGEIKEDDWVLFSSFLPIEGNNLSKVKFLKERGNDFFKQNMFESAGGYYDMACRLLCLVLESKEDYQGEFIVQLAISLNLNLAACANKLLEYEAAINFCSLVLSAFPKNAKALFRRAIACMKTDMLVEAQTDIETASMIEPKNKDILRELNVVKNLRAINHNGKRNIDDQLLKEVDRESKRPIMDVENIEDVEKIRDTPDNDKGGSSNGSCVIPSSFDSIVKDVSNSEVILPINGEQNTSPNMESMHKHEDIKMGENEHIPNNSVLEFSRRGGGNSRLRISGRAYKKILEGSKVSYYHKRNLSLMTIQIHNIEDFKEDGTTRHHDKRRKRRRHSKQRKPKTKGVHVDGFSSPSGINESLDFKPTESSFGGISSRSSSVCDNLSSCSQISQEAPTVVPSNTSLPLSPVIDTGNISNYSQAHKDSNEHELFIFSAFPKKCKSYSIGKSSRASTTSRLYKYLSKPQVSEKRRINKSKKKHSQGNESPRHNTSTSGVSRSLSSNFLRPSGVSVSCCRYSLEAQLTKKRKGVSTQLPSSDRPLKKSFSFANPMCSFISFADNVRIMSDLESRIDTV